MDNNSISLSNYLELIDRKHILIKGVEKVKSINETQFIAKVQKSNLLITGNSMQLTKLDLDSGIVEIDGEINSIKYSNSVSGQNIFKRIFK